MLYRDRADAGSALAEKLKQYRDCPEVLVLALPRGGVPVGYEVARTLHAPLDVFIVRKLGVPGREELAMGALASGSVRVMNPDAEALAIPPRKIEAVVRREQQELDRRERVYRGNRPAPVIRDRVVILVDDGLATGSTISAPNKTAAQVGEKAGWLRAMGSSRRSAWGATRFSQGSERFRRVP